MTFLMKIITLRDLVWFTALVGLLWLNSTTYYFKIVQLQREVKSLKNLDYNTYVPTTLVNK